MKQKFKKFNDKKILKMNSNGISIYNSPLQKINIQV
jgi:hypothetical protein